MRKKKTWAIFELNKKSIYSKSISVYAISIKYNLGYSAVNYLEKFLLCPLNISLHRSWLDIFSLSITIVSETMIITFKVFKMNFQKSLREIN